jgi:hypothetical protein
MALEAVVRRRGFPATLAWMPEAPGSRHAATPLAARRDSAHHDSTRTNPRAAAWRAAKVNDDINVLALVKGKERYIFLFDDSQRSDALRVLGRYASNVELSFNWYDAAVLSQKVRQTGPVYKAANRVSLHQPTDFDD